MPLRPGVCSSPEAGYPATTSSGKFVNRPRTIALLAITVVLTVTATVSCSTAPEPAPEVATADAPVTHEENDRVPEGAAWTQHYFPSVGRLRHRAARRRPAARGAADGERCRSSCRSARTSATPAARAGGLDPHRPLRPVPGLHGGHRPVRPRLRLRHGGPARLRRLHRLPRLGRPRRAGGRQGGDRLGGEPAVVDRRGGHVRQVVRRRHRPDRQQPGPRRAQAVVAQEPIWDMYRNICSNGVPRPNITERQRHTTPSPRCPSCRDDPRYRANAGTSAPIRSA